MTIITLIYFVFVLAVTIMIHEFGHFLFAKRAGIYVYEFSLGMGPRLFHFKRKNDETEYAIRLFPFGGYVSMAGEDIEADKDIPAEKTMQAKTWMQRFLTIIAGVLFNFLLAIVLLFVVGLINGAPITTPKIAYVENSTPAALAGLKAGDTILKIDGQKVANVDRFLLEFQVRIGDSIELLVERKDGTTTSISIIPEKNAIDSEVSYSYGFSLDNTKKHGFLPALQYAFTKTASLVEQMCLIVGYLFTGQLSLNSLSGPVGIFTVVGESAKAGFLNIIYLIAYLCINVGFINLIPFPAFDGGRLLFLIIEKIKGSPVKPKVENTIHTVGFLLLMLLMVVITYNDILRLIH